MLYEFATTEDGRVSVRSDRDVARLARAHGRESAGHCSNPRVRAELQGQPRISRMYGPMWGGLRNSEPVIRYEDAEAYNGFAT